MDRTRTGINWDKIFEIRVHRQLFAIEYIKE